MLKLSAQRALDLLRSSRRGRPHLAALKYKQAELFGKSHTLAVREIWFSLADTLKLGKP